MTAQPIRFTPAARESQAVFRAVLQALARPGLPQALPPVAPFVVDSAKYAFAVLAALADHEVMIAVTGGEEAAHQARLATGSTIAPLDQAEYVLALKDDPAIVPVLGRGTIEAPEAGATLIVSVASVSDERGIALRLSGPGVPGSVVANVRGLSTETVAARSVACSGFPTGIDLLLVDESGRCIGIPRTTTVEVEV